ncbi:eukaryotic translation initiation factor 2A-like [Liolophura sinensis]|uniref:eukaryotic translation initiation factor 2A-like n=1 Tax=Liolophura sinensis TaxID=3198878 RepID=UPI003158E07A
MAASTVPKLALRGSQGLWLANGYADFQEVKEFPRESTPTCKGLTFSEDGTLLAWTTEQSLKIVKFPSCQLLYEKEHPRLACLQFSPKGTYLAAWEPYRVNREAQSGIPNLHFYNMETGALEKSLFQKKQAGWAPQWSQDEGIMGRSVNNELQFNENNNLDKITQKLHVQKVTEFSISPCTEKYYVAAYVPGSKGQPSFMRVYQYPNFGGPEIALANKSFFNADRINFHWNPKGTSFLLLTSTESSDSSYYGDQKLHYLSTNGETSMVHLGKNGPVYSIQWSPESNNEFTVVYGYMPAKATIYNSKCEPLFDFGTGPRNEIYYNCFGNILCLCGFGNLRGNMEFWDAKKHRLICQMRAEDTTFFSWCPDGEHVVTATLAPRLRVGNGYKIWHYTGCLLHHEKVPSDQALWQVMWQPVPGGVFKQQPTKYKPIDSSLVPTEAKTEAYRAPMSKGRPSQPLHTYEPASNAKPAQNPENMSKAALKNKKKREARKAKQEEEAGAERAEVPPTSQGSSQGAGFVIPSTGNPEIDKKIKNLVKKLQQIEKLKEQQREGKTLEKNQLDKLKTEDALMKELQDLTINS